MERKQIRYTGRVQGVGFRATTRSIASGYTVTGWVRNEPDGSVLMEVQGDPGEVARCVGELNQTMERNISSADEREATPVTGEAAFEIRY